MLRNHVKLVARFIVCNWRVVWWRGDHFSCVGWSPSLQTYERTCWAGRHPVTQVYTWFLWVEAGHDAPSVLANGVCVRKC
jgi:hypothetical protein